MAVTPGAVLFPGFGFITRYIVWGFSRDRHRLTALRRFCVWCSLSASS
ncbi:MAG: hypothetical protein IIZ54_06775 [Selenomonadaceae bacterium]|nr:hypothetical protein [Selenomonadaceae bacterium]